MFFSDFNFFGRNFELNTLNKMYEENGFSFACIYGRRRVGKSFLIKKFIQDSNYKCISFTAIEYNDYLNLQEFTNKIFEIYPNGKNYINVFENWSQALDYIALEAKKEKLIIYIDEFPYIANTNNSISSILQSKIDEVFINSNIKLILCGSSMSFMKKQVLGYESPLYGRRTLQLEIKPFDYFDTAKMIEDYSIEDKILMYAISGGIPYYVNILKQNKNLEESIINAFFTISGALYEEPNNLLKQELREPALYNSIINAIALGNTRLNNISTKINEEDIKVNKYLSILIDLHIIKKEIPIFNISNRRSIYKIVDNMYNFWFKYIPTNTTNIENGLGDKVYLNKVKPNIQVYLGHIFEDVCKQFLLKCNNKGTLPFLFDTIGKWWGGNSKTKTEEEIDIVAFDSKNIIYGECKYKNEIVNESIYDILYKKSLLLNQDKKSYFYLFSKSGFSRQLKEIAFKNKNIFLIELEDLFKL